uniref:Uncharacterized protein n=1 Tax=Chromera velia CCMP2878 TaxID=1169474 RepID=A0A0G4I9T0_9ALVE|eukprot:Cvel_12355.t1-p1 / transcript=Cvel_12355.t1 / gene=Cvel_12355 / organism=Chromera_velia_CCMP2878 / gene_product=hypothetical protein / transcript_product=hypothetical protein / location=Cvel_scaffold804:30892-39822(-) / protein_length=153 / sequence_SO=supercontig / SO=protein_coding / is_pseudo=false
MLFHILQFNSIKSLEGPGTGERISLGPGPVTGPSLQTILTAVEANKENNENKTILTRLETTTSGHPPATVVSGHQTTSGHPPAIVVSGHQASVDMSTRSVAGLPVSQAPPPPAPVLNTVPGVGAFPPLQFGYETFQGYPWPPMWVQKELQQLQ